MSVQSRPSNWLNAYASNTYSQSGEDGIIEAILKVLRPRDAVCVEVGAADGRTHSNTRRICELGYTAYWIEADDRRFEQLMEQTIEVPGAYGRHHKVGFGENDGLDPILVDWGGIPSDFDFLSIDIDGVDYHVWKAMQKYRPKVVCIEFNPTIPTEILFVQSADSEIHQGSSLAALVALGKEKGYELIATTSFNAFFVDQKYYPLFGIYDNSPYALRADLRYITFMFQCYDGHVYLAGNSIMPWHDVVIDQERVQMLPGWLQKFPSDYTRFERLSLRALKKWRAVLERLRDMKARLFP